MSSYEISKSSLLSLKAEILRKQQELVKAKVDNEVKIRILKNNTPLEIKNKGVEKRQMNDAVDEDILKQSRSVLEAKSKLYEKLSSGNLTEEQKEFKKRVLVRFDKKISHDLPSSDSEDSLDQYPKSEEECYHSDNDEEKDPKERWVDYVDCLGRTRKCLQKDLEYLMENDEDLRKTVEVKKKDRESNELFKSTENINKNDEDVSKELSDDKEQNIAANEPELLSNDMRREMFRRQWAKEEYELRNKSDIHYQDILFGEARTHGVGYYGFSKDEEERAKQQEALKRLRIETEQKQKKAQELKAMREKQLAARIKAAKHRKRARLGLPPEEEASEVSTEPKITEEENREQEELKQKELDKEKLLEEARKRHLRPWDIGKEGVKQHYEMTQEEWVETKRKERPKEFAPPTIYKREFRSIVKDDHMEDVDKSLRFTTKKSRKEKRRRAPKRSSENLYKSSISNSPEESNTIEVHNEQNTNRVYANSCTQEKDLYAGFEPSPIVDLCEDADLDVQSSKNNEIMQNTSNQPMDSSDSDDDRSQQGGVDKSLRFTTKKSREEKRRAHKRSSEKSINPYKSSISNPPEESNTTEIHNEQNTNSSDANSCKQDKDLYASFEPTPIVDLCEDADLDVQFSENYEMQNTSNKSIDSSDSDDDRSKRRGVEIAPPPTFDYYGPSHSKRHKNTCITTNIEDSIEAGLKFLRTQIEKKQESSKRDSEMYLL